MARVLIDSTTMTVRVEGLHRFLAFRRSITAPLAHVLGATVDPGGGLRAQGPAGARPGLGRVATIGTFYRDDQRPGTSPPADR